MTTREEQMISKEIKKLIPVVGKESASRLLRAYLLGDEDTRERVFELVDVLKAAVFAEEGMKETTLLEPPPKEVASAGDVEMGTVMYGKKELYPLKMREDMFLTHMGIFGSTGYGKTNIAYWTIKKLAERNIPILIFDFSKRNYKELLQTDLADKIEIYTVGRDAAPFKFNPLKSPEGISQSQWIKEFSAIFDHAYWMMGGGRHVMLKALDAVNKIKDNPRIKDLKTWLKEYSTKNLPSRERNWIATAGRPLESLTLREVGKIFETDQGIKPSDFFKKGKITVLELDALDTNDKTFFIEIMLQWIRDWLLVSKKREELMGAIILEEAHHVLNREKAAKTGAETVIDLVFREIRELGAGIIYLDQHPSLVSYPALGNTSTTIYMNLGLDVKHASDIVDASNMLGLDYEEEGSYLRRLPVGQGFMLMRMSKFTQPFLVKFKYVDIKKGAITDEIIEKHMRKKAPKIYEMYEEEKEEKPKEIKGNVPEDVTEEGGKELNLEELGRNEWRIIRAIGKGTGAYTSAIYQALKMSGSTFATKSEHLVDFGLIGMTKGKRGKNALCYYYLSDFGVKAFRQRYGRPEVSGAIDKKDIIKMFEMSGWKGESKDSKVVLTQDGKELVLYLADKPDRDSIRNNISNGVHVLACNENMYNIVIQEAARKAQKEGKQITIFISTEKDFGDSGKFKKIELNV